MTMEKLGDLYSEGMSTKPNSDTLFSKNVSRV